MAVVSLSSLLLLASPVLAASSIASWTGLSGTQIRSKIILQGGLLTWADWDNSSSSYVNSKLDPALRGVLYEINLNQSFNVADNISDYLTKGPDIYTDDSPNYVYGSIFNNYYSWFTFGGLASKQVSNPDISTIIRGNEYSQGAGYFAEQVDYNQPRTPPVSDYIAGGSYASSPDQSIGWWYGGMISTNSSAPLEYSAANDYNKPAEQSRLFIQANMATDGSQKVSFSYLDVPNWLTGRSQGALMWLPYGTKGSLLFMGGVEDSADLDSTNAGNPANNTYMTDLVIYDVGANAWYNQSTVGGGGPTQMAAFCTAVVQTADKKGHEIFIYGGYDGTYADMSSYNDVWVLSLPAFQWTKVYDGFANITHGRQGNVCVAPNPTTLITIGGYTVLGSSITSEYAVDIFDLNKLQWTGTYDPSANDTLNVPDAAVKQIGGSYSASGPGDNYQASGLSSNVATLFSSPYQQTVRTWFPYNTTSSGSGTTNNTTTPTPTPVPAPNHTLAIALGVVIPIVVIAALIIGFCCLKKRRKNKEGVQRTQESRGNVFSWLGKSSPIDPAPEKSHTTDETAVDSANEYTHDKHPVSQIYEAPGSNPTTPGWGNHGNQQVLGGSMATSPFMGSAEVDAQSRHEIMDHAPRDGQSLSQHHMYQRSFSGDQVMSVRSDSISHASTSAVPTRHYGYVSPSYELPEEHSREDLTAPPADVNLGAPRSDAANPNASTHSLGLGAEHVHSPVALLPVAPVSRKPLHSAPVQDDDRPRHQRNQSSMSSDLPNLPSPGPEEDRRRSRLIDTLPDPKSGQASPVQPQTQTAKRSVYKEDLDS